MIDLPSKAGAIVGMVIFKGEIYIACKYAIYKQVEDKLILITQVAT
jgi:hypothetical protein